LKALVISITGDNVESDVIAAKAAALFAEETQLASARLYFTLRDALEASSRHGGGLSRDSAILPNGSDSPKVCDRGRWYRMIRG